MKPFRIYILLFFTLFLVIFSTSCRQQPENTVKGFASHWYKGEIEEAKKYVTEESKAFIELIEQTVSVEYLESIRNASIEVVSCDCQPISDSVVNCKNEIMIDNIPNTVSFQLIKENRKWCININK